MLPTRCHFWVLWLLTPLNRWKDSFICLKSIHFKNTITRSSFHLKLWPFSIIHHLTSKKVRWCIIENGHSFEWNEDYVTVFLKWIDFSKDCAPHTTASPLDSKSHYPFDQNAKTCDTAGKTFSIRWFCILIKRVMTVYVHTLFLFEHLLKVLLQFIDTYR